MLASLSFLFEWQTKIVGKADQEKVVIGNPKIQTVIWQTHFQRF